MLQMEPSVLIKLRSLNSSSKERDINSKRVTATYNHRAATSPSPHQASEGAHSKGRSLHSWGELIRECTELQDENRS